MENFIVHVILFAWISYLCLYFSEIVRNRTQNSMARWVIILLFFACTICVWVGQYTAIINDLKTREWLIVPLLIMIFPFFIISAVVTQDFVENVEYICKRIKKLHNNKPKRNLLFRMYDRICYFTKKVYNSIVKKFIWKK